MIVVRAGLVFIFFISFVACSDSSSLKKNMDLKMNANVERAKRRIEYVKPVLKKGVRYEELRSARSHGFNQNGVFYWLLMQKQMNNCG